MQYLSVPISKRVKGSDGSVTVFGKVTDETLDLDGQVVDAATAAQALDEWFQEHANIRQQHSGLLAPAGKGIQLDHEKDGPWLTAKIVEPTAVKLVEEGVYQAFSIGIADGRLDTTPTARKRAPNGILYPSLINEVSIVDYPANPSAKFLWARKRAGQAMEIIDKNEILDPSISENDDLVYALKSLHGNIVATFATDEEAQATIGTTWDEREYEAHGNVVVKKRNFDPGVGGGVDRDKLPKSDFADPEQRKYPIVTPKDVEDAAGLVGHADNPTEVKANIIRIAHAKGPEFVAKLPENWKETKVEKSAGTQHGPECPTCKGTGKIRDGHMTCPKCKGKGFVTATKGEIPDVDEKITEDLNEADTAIDDAKDEQAKDNAQHEAKKRKTKKKVSKAARRLAKEAAKARVKKGRIVVSESELVKLQSVHDTLCPAFESVPALAKKSVPATILPEMFADRLSAISGSKATPGSIAEASEAYLAAHQVSRLSAKSLTHLRALAHKTFTTAYPNLRINSPDLSSPEAFRRGFLGSSNKETATTMDHPTNFPTAKPLDAQDIQRGPLVANEARPSLMGGTPAKDLVATKRKTSRQFYRNVDKDKNVKAMSILHDHIASNYPSVCPLSGAHAIANETEDRLGTPPEMYSPASSVTKIDAKADAKPKPVHARANKGRGRSLDLAAIKPVLDEYMTEQISSVTKSYTKRIGKLEAKLKKVAAAPDPAQASNRLTRFQTTKAFVPEVDESKKETVKRAKSLTRDIRDRNSTFAQQAVVELQDLVSAKEFASLMISDDE